MHKNTITPIAQLLAQAGSTHHRFEQTVLNGIYDEAWPDWYAGHLLEHNLNDLLAQPVNQTELSRFLFHSNQVRKQHHPEPNWVEYTARDIITRFANLPQR